VASYHLSVKTVRRSQGRSATAAAAYRSAERILCEREGRVHDYGRKGGVEATLLIMPEHAPEWALDRERLWNAAEAAERRKDAVVAREWELALPAELTPEGRRALAQAFAERLVERYGVAADVAIHAPHREGDQRNHHAHVLTTTRALEREGLGAKTKALDTRATGPAEITAMREVWAGLQNEALERAERERGLERGALERVDHRRLEVQREAALRRGERERAEGLERAPEAKLGPAASAMERRAEREAEAAGHEYEPVTERGRRVHEARALRERVAELQREVRERAELARERYALAREEGLGRVSAGLAALRAAAERDRERVRERGAEPEDLRERLRAILGRQAEREAERGTEGEMGRGAERGVGLERERDRAPEDGRSLTERLRSALDGARSAPPARELQTEQEERERERAREMKRERGLGRGLDDGLEL
jgi:ATP-dependent exoDNAse (exonuclease V) alpha subunit